MFRVSISTLLLQMWFGAASMPVYAVSPGWNTSNSSSSSSSSSESSSSASSVENSPSSSDDNNQPESSAPREADNSSYGSSSSSSVSESSSSRSDDGSNSQSSSSEPIDQSSSSSSSSSSASDTSSSASLRTYTISELLTEADLQYSEKLATLLAANKQSVVDNNNKGANELYSAYQVALKNIKSGKTTLEEREASVATQKTALQEALSIRLNSLQDTYNQQVQIVQNEINQLPNDHAHDKVAISLQDKLASLDYQLSHDSNLAYTRYDKAVAKLNRQAARVPVKSKKEQRADAKTTYLENLAAVHAQDPKSLAKENSKKVSDLKSNYRKIKVLIKSNQISTPDDITKHF